MRLGSATARAWTALLVLTSGGIATDAGAEERAGFGRPEVERLILDDAVAGGDAGHEVALLLRAETRLGEPVENLQPADLVVRDNDERIDPEDLSLSLLSEATRDGAGGAACVIALDNSRTMMGEPFDRARAAALSFLDRLDASHRVAVVAFSSDVRVIASFADSARELREQLGALEVNEESLSTALFDGIHRSVALLRERDDLPRRRFVIVFSDGRDSGSIRTLAEVVRHGGGDELRPRIPISTIGHARFGGDGLANLKAIAEKTAGQFFHASSTDHLASFFNEIRRQMMDSYIVRYPGRMDGERHTIQVGVEGQTASLSLVFPRIARPLWHWLLGGLALVLALATVLLARPRRSAGELLIQGSDSAGTSYALRGPQIRLGALADNDVVLNSPHVSRHHARIRVRRGTAELEDLQSANGTYVNGTAIRTAELRPGDKIRIGDVELVFQR